MLDFRQMDNVSFLENYAVLQATSSNFRTKKVDWKNRFGHL